MKTSSLLIVLLAMISSLNAATIIPTDINRIRDTDNNGSGDIIDTAGGFNIFSPATGASLGSRIVTTFFIGGITDPVPVVTLDFDTYPNISETGTFSYHVMAVYPGTTSSQDTVLLEDYDPTGFNISVSPFTRNMSIGTGISDTYSIDNIVQQWKDDFSADYLKLVIIPIGYTGASEQALQFDNVRLTVAVPEPATTALVVGGIALAATLRRRKK